MVTEPVELPGLYVHTPFCRSRCHYCDFYSTTDESTVDRWIDGVIAEAGQHRGRWEDFDTLYLGGGTPSLIPLDGLERLLGGLRSTLEVAADAEVTLEVNPDDVDPRLAGRWRALGVNRVSLGVQSFDDEILGGLGRRHTARDAEEAVGILLDAGFVDLGIDLIFGTPGVELSGWSAALERALALPGIKHLSCYELTIEARTEIGRRVASGELEPAEEELGREMFLECAKALHGRFEHYEVSNYALDDGRGWRSRHNTKYWHHVPYLGLGPSAHSLAGRERRWNFASLTRWAGALDRGEDPTEGREQLTADQWTLEELMLGLRTSDGVPLDLARAADPGGGRLKLMRDLVLLEVADERVRPTTLGMLMADGLPLMLMGLGGDGS